MAYNQRYLFTNIDRKEQWAYILSVEANEISQTDEDKNLNRSRINITGKLRSQYYNYSAGRDQKLQIWWQDDYGNLKEVMLAETKFKTIGYKGEIVVSGVANVNHKPDGTLNGKAIIKFIKDTTSKYAPENGNIDVNFALTTIPRATILSNKTLTIGKNSTISWTKASDNFTHKLEYTFGKFSGVIGTGLVDSVNWTPSNDLYSVIPNNPSGKGTLTLTTYNGNTITGTSIATLTLNANENDAKAQITNADVIDYNSNTKKLTGDANKLILNASSSYIGFNITTRQYAKAKEIYINENSYYLSGGSESGSNTNYRFEGNLGISQTGTYDIIVVDTRGYKTLYKVSKPTINYIILDSNAKIKRIAPTTGEVGLTFDGNYFNGGFGKVNNYLKISYAYRIKNTGNYSAFKPITQFKILGNTFHSGTANYKQTIKLAESFDYRNTYDIQIKFEDAITTKITNATIVKGIPIFWWNATKFSVDGDLFVADVNGNNAVNILEKIKNNSTAISNNANAIKTNKESIDTLKPKILYINQAGEFNNILLNDDFTNYSYIEVFYSRNEFQIKSVKVPTNLAKNGVLTFETSSSYYGYGTGFFASYKAYKITTANPRLIVEENKGNGYIISADGKFTTSTEDLIKIYEVIAS